MKDQITETRLKIDALTTVTSKLQGSPEITKAMNSLKMSKAWLGKLRGLLGESTPYKNDGNRKSVNDIEPTNDVGMPVHIHLSSEEEWSNMNHIEKVDYIRQEIQSTLKQVDHIAELNENRYHGDLDDKTTELAEANKEISEGQKVVPSGYLELGNVITHLSEARFWLGFELQRIKESSPQGNVAAM